MWRDGNGPSGQMTSPNFSTGKYPNSFHESKTIKVGKGHFVQIRFTDFDLAWTGRLDLNSTSHEWIVNHTPVADYVEITDGDGTFLGKFGPQHKPDDGKTLPHGHTSWKGFVGIKMQEITSFTDTVHVLFHTDERSNATGWRLEWSKLTVCLVWS